MRRKEPGCRGILGVALLIVWHVVAGDEASAERPKPLLIVPFQGVGSTPASQWIGDGVAEALQLAFVRIPAVLLIDQTRLAEVSPTSFDDRGIVTLGRTLGAELVFYGNYERGPAGGVALLPRYLEIKGGEGRPLEPLRGSSQQLLELQSDLVRAYLRRVSLGLKPGEMDNVAAAARPTTSLTAYEAYVRGRRLAMQRTRAGLEGAAELFARAVEVDPGFGIAHYHLGMTHLALGNRWKAAPQFRAASHVDPSLPEPYRALGDLLMTSPRRLHDQAIEAYQKAIALRPHYADAYVGLGDARAAKGDADGALGAYKRALAVDASNARVHLSMGKIYNDRGLYYEAVDAHRRAIELDPRSIEARMALGEIFEEKGLYQEAIGEYKKVIEADSRHTGARYNLALTYEKVDVREAIAAWERYIEIASAIPAEKDWVDIARQHLRKLRTMERKD